MELILFFVLASVSFSFASVCKKEFEETVCENFVFSPNLVLDSGANKLTIKNSQGSIIHENFAKLHQVTELLITGSTIKNFEPRALCSLPNLTSITLVNNKKVPKITRNTLYGCQHLKRIYIDGPGVEIENNAFINCENLQILSLNDTVLPQLLDKNLLSGLEALKSLTIQHSNCTKVKKDVFTPVKNLKFLDLQNNKLTTLPVNIFDGLVELKVLNLADNKLNLTWNEFKGLKSLKVLFLERNDFEFVDVDKLVASVPNLERVFVSYEKLSPESRQKIEETLPKLKITFIYIRKPFEINK